MPVRRYRGIRIARSAPRALRAIAVFACILLVPRTAFAQQVLLANNQGLDFGRFVASGGGNVIVAPTGVRSRTGAVVLLNSPSVRQATFRVSRNGTGGGNKAVVISLPSNGATRLSSGANSMAVNNFVSSPATLPSIPAGGTTLAIGATLTVAPQQVPGNYSGSFSLIVNYQ